jgi:hypothetical protein
LALRAVVFDVGETLIDETGMWGPWGLLHDPPPAALRVESLDELPEALDV